MKKILSLITTFSLLCASQISAMCTRWNDGQACGINHVCQNGQCLMVGSSSTGNLERLLLEDEALLDTLAEEEALATE